MKKLLYVLSGIVLVVVIAVGILVTVVNPNQFKPLIVDQVKTATGRDLVIDGDIGWRFWPSLGFSIEKLAFRNPQGFAENDMVRLDSAGLSVSVMPLLSQHLEVGMISLHGARVFIQTLADGTTNYDDLLAAGNENEAAPAAQSSGQSEDSAGEPSANPGEQTGDAEAPWTLELQGVELVDASALIRDDKAGTVSEISRLNLKVGEVAMESWVPLEFDVEGKQDALTFTARGSSDLFLVADAVKSRLRQLAVSATASDAAIKLESFNLNADQLGLGLPASVSFSMKGNADGMGFDTSGTSNILVSENVKLATVTGLDIVANLNGASLPRPDMVVKLAADAKYDVDKQQASLSKFKASADELAVDGDASILLASDIPAIRFNVHSSEINLDEFLASMQQLVPETASNESATTAGGTPATGDKGSSADTAPAKAKAPLSDVEPDLSALKGLDIAGTARIDKLIASNAKVSDVALDFAVNRGLVTIKDFDARLYSGKVSAKGTVDARQSPASYQITKAARGINVLPLLKDVADNDLLAGVGNIDANVTGSGLSEKRLRSAINGTVAINFVDGAINGVNLPEMIREAKATLKGKRAEYVEEERKTDFSALTATFNLGKGIASTQNLKMEAPALRVNSKGQTDLLAETLNFDVLTSVVGTSKGQGGKGTDELADVTIPVDIAGTWQAPTYKLDIKSLLSSNKVLEEKAQKEAERGLKKLLGDKADDDKVKQVADKLLKGLFN